MGERDRAVTLLTRILHDAPDSYEAPLARARLLEWATPAPALPPEAGEEEAAPAGPEPFRGYAVQVGAFSLADNAKSLAEAVEQRGFAPVRVVRGEDDLNRVLVGRFETRDEAEAFGDSLGITLGVGFSVVANRED
jgi:cell division septation protein DedD